MTGGAADVWPYVALTVAIFGVPGTIGLIGYRLANPKPVVVQSEMTEPMCGCGHHLAFHDPDTRACNGLAGTAATCRCQQYTGPVYVDELLSRPILPPPAELP